MNQSAPLRGRSSECYLYSYFCPMNQITFEWKFYSLLEPKPYEFNGNSWISYRCKILAFDDLMQFKLTQEQNLALKDVKEMTPVIITGYLKPDDKNKNVFNVTDIQPKRV